MHGEPDLAIRVVRDVFNEDFKRLAVQGDDAWRTVSEYIEGVAPDLGERVARHTGESDLFHELRVDEQLMKALDRKVWLPSGGSLVIDRTEAMTVIDVNTGKFVGSGGNLEQTVTRNNLEAAEEIVRQLRLRDVGGIVVIDFIDMVLESNRDLVLRRLTECLGRDRTKHQVAEVTSLGLVQMTRKRVGEGLLEAFSETCEACHGRGVILHGEPVDRNGSPSSAAASADDDDDSGRGRSRRRRSAKRTAEVEAVAEVSDEQRGKALAAMSAIHRASHSTDQQPVHDAEEISLLNQLPDSRIAELAEVVAAEAGGGAQGDARSVLAAVDAARHHVPAPVPAPEPAAEQAPEPAAEQAPEPAAPVASPPPAEQAAEQTPEPTAEQAAEQTPEPTAEQAPEPRAGALSAAQRNGSAPDADGARADGADADGAHAEPPVEPAAPARPRRRRAASRPAGPPTVG